MRLWRLHAIYLSLIIMSTWYGWHCQKEGGAEVETERERFSQIRYIYYSKAPHCAIMH